MAVKVIEESDSAFGTSPEKVNDIEVDAFFIKLRESALSRCCSRRFLATAESRVISSREKLYGMALNLA